MGIFSTSSLLFKNLVFLIIPAPWVLLGHRMVLKMGLSSRKVCMSKEREPASGAPERARRTTGGNPKAERNGRGPKQLPSRESYVRPRILPCGPAVHRVQSRASRIVGKRVQELSSGLPQGAQKAGRTAVFRTENKGLILDLVWKVTCLLDCHDSIPSIGTGSVSGDRWEFARCIADLAMGCDNCGPSVQPQPEG